mmetsp:Transcript_23720/g.16791  ORF Transcript_23720/g.16791 Transcript_23720/m.16791 type:complete len:104 (+) Transcript_23720:578-889(+)|eukprot:CAMPEP_0116875176 /NCGR_PEP_ID=MMETSP0463-20121206/6971_1 /TAXON_ID=181622 /ORGANISM="Strombidinopsis sp, Strain SopsisLIS2011" /LENGTH=103 /DNA_ID=CAMNT_0004520225 /DNA_START=1080 /DNA_END=1391 /DNA_ORIENTATION=+
MGVDMYHILLILTDGCLHDMKETIDLIVKCSNNPMSIIILGIGDADFSSMEHLDSDDFKLIDSKGNETKRDIVQFVPFRKFKNDHGETNLNELADEVLAEVPD